MILVNGQQAGQLTNPNLAQSRLRQLAKDAWQQTTEAGRGPGCGPRRCAIGRP
jgi:hypothetical protein